MDGMSSRRFRLDSRTYGSLIVGVILPPMSCLERCVPGALHGEYEVCERQI